MKKVIAITKAFATAQLVTNCLINMVQSLKVNTEDNSRLLTLHTLWGKLYQLPVTEYKTFALKAYKIACLKP